MMRVRFLAAAFFLGLISSVGGQAQQGFSSLTMIPSASAFSVTAELWPARDLAVGSASEIILNGQMRNESREGLLWRGMAPQSKGYGQVRNAGELSPVCETPRTDERRGSWESPFEAGSSTPYSYEFGDLTCKGSLNQAGSVEARFCANPNMFPSLPDGTCSAWVPVKVDRVAAAVRTDDAVFHVEMANFEKTGDPALQRRLLGALQLRALRDAPEAYERGAKYAGKPDAVLVALWLDFFKAEAVALQSQPARVPVTYNMGRYGPCPTTAPATYPCSATGQAAEDKRLRQERENKELSALWKLVHERKDTTQRSLLYFGMYMGPQFGNDRVAKDAVYANAQAQGLPAIQVSELRRFLEFSTGGEAAGPVSPDGK